MMKIMFPKIPEKDGNPYHEKFHDLMNVNNIKPEVWYEYEIVLKKEMPIITHWIYDIRLIDLDVIVRIPVTEILKGFIKVKEDNEND